MFFRVITHTKFIPSVFESKRLASLLSRWREASSKRFSGSRSPRAAWFRGGFTAAFTAAISVFAWGLADDPIAVLAAAQSSPVASVDQTTYDFGEVYEGEHISHTFTVRNTGSVPLEVRDPAAKAENPENDRTRVAVDFESGHGIPRLAGQAGFSDHSFAGQTQATVALHPLVAARGRPAAPA
jgi:hypothetical protein